MTFTANLPIVLRMTLLPIYLLILIIFMNRYLAGGLLKRLRRKQFDATVDDFVPTVTVVVPLFNEGETIYATIKSLLQQDYPCDKLTITVVDDCSTDDSYAWAKKAEAEDPDRVLVIRNPHNMGKRRGINNAVRTATAEIIVSVDSDVLVDPRAVRELTRRFTDPSIAAVGGRVNVSNPNDNWLSKMQTVKYYFGYVYLKNVERAFRSVMCLSGCLTAYRRHVLIELEPILENRNILGVPIKYGEDRYLTRHIVKAGYKTTLTLDATCATKVPTTISKYFAQQLRWRRSNLVDYALGLSHAWRLHPVVAMHYTCMFALLVAYPLIVFRNIVSGDFWQLASMHLAILSGFSAIYCIDTWSLPSSQRVHPIWFLALGIVMPVTYLLHTVLALFTLDSGSWETRGHKPQSEPGPTSDSKPPVYVRGAGLTPGLTARIHTRLNEG